MMASLLGEIFSIGLELIEYIGWGATAWNVYRVAVAVIEPIKAIEIEQAIILGYQALPFLVHRFMGVRVYSLDQQNAGINHSEISAGQDLFLEAFDIDLQKVNSARTNMLLPDIGKRDDFDINFLSDATGALVVSGQRDV
jgi:homoserine trans-succinylase